jgi:RimJ/RimL family protein N-acetyltransferase
LPCRGTQRIIGEALNDNRAVLNLATRLGFKLSPSADQETMKMRPDLVSE